MKQKEIDYWRNLNKLAHLPYDWYCPTCKAGAKPDAAGRCPTCQDICQDTDMAHVCLADWLYDQLGGLLDELSDYNALKEKARIMQIKLAAYQVIPPEDPEDRAYCLCCHAEAPEKTPHEVVHWPRCLLYPLPEEES